MHGWLEGLAAASRIGAAASASVILSEVLFGRPQHMAIVNVV